MVSFFFFACCYSVSLCCKLSGRYGLWQTGLVTCSKSVRADCTGLIWLTATLRERARERERERGEKMHLRMSSYFSVLSPHFLPGGRLCCSMCCSCSSSSGSSSSVSCSGIVIVAVLVWVWTGKSVPTLIRWLIRLPVRQASTALRGCLSEVRVRTSAAIQLFIVLTWAWGFSGWPRTRFK